MEFTATMSWPTCRRPEAGPPDCTAATLAPAPSGASVPCTPSQPWTTRFWDRRSSATPTTRLLGRNVAGDVPGSGS